VQISNTYLLGPTRVHTPNGMSIGSAVFAQLTAEGPCTLQWAAPSPSICPCAWMDLDPRLIRASLGLSGVGPAQHPKRRLDRVSRFYRGEGRRSSQTDRPLTPAVTIGPVRYIRISL